MSEERKKSKKGDDSLSSVKSEVKEEMDESVSGLASLQPTQPSTSEWSDDSSEDEGGGGKQDKTDDDSKSHKHHKHHKHHHSHHHSKSGNTNPDGDQTTQPDSKEGIVKHEVNAWETPLPDSLTSSSSVVKQSRWDETPVDSSAVPQKRSRWDATPVSSTPSSAPSSSDFSAFAATPLADSLQGAVTPAPAAAAAAAAFFDRASRELDSRNRWLTDADLDALLPSEGYEILEPPPGYVSLRSASQRLSASAAAAAEEAEMKEGINSGFHMNADTGVTSGTADAAEAYGIIEMPDDLPSIRAEERSIFEPLLAHKKESETGDMEEEDVGAEKEREILRLLLYVKSGDPWQRKKALRRLTDGAREFGPEALLNGILPLLMSRGLDGQERHLLVKVLGRVLWQLGDLIRPFVHKVLVPVEPLLIDEDRFARAEGRELVSSLAKAAGLHTMIAAMRADIDSANDWARSTTATAFSVVAAALGIPALLPFLGAVCRSRKSWRARHTGQKIIQQTAILCGCGVLPHLRSLVELVRPALQDEQGQVRTMAALAAAALAEASAPYGIEAFNPALKALWDGVEKHRGKTLAAFLKAVGAIIPLLESGDVKGYTEQVMSVLIREFESHDEEMRRVVLRVVRQAVAAPGVPPQYVKEKILPDLLRCFWITLSSTDKSTSRQLIDTTVEVAKKVGSLPVVVPLIPTLKHDNESFRRMALETINTVVGLLGIAELDTRGDELLVDGLLSSFQFQSAEGSDRVVLDAFATVISSMGLRARAYLAQICGTIKFRLESKQVSARQQAADLLARIAPVIHSCGEELMLTHLSQMLNERLGEEYPEVLGSILGALKSVVNVVGMEKMSPPISELLPRLTPILRNRNEKVQENLIDLVGRIADRGSECVSSREWMRICFEMLEMLKSPKKSIRRATINTFGYIAKAIGPADVLVTLLDNLKVQERQLRVCTTIAIAIVAETCAPFTVIPALMAEYRVPDQLVQNGVLKSLGFLFEYIGEMGKDYVYAVAPLLTDALMEREIIHRQQALTVVKHIAVNCYGLSCEDVLTHLLNYVWPNVFETFPHTIAAFYEAVDALRLALGPAPIMNFLLAGLFHPARKVRNAYWRVYNNMYVGAQEAMVPTYPCVEDDEYNTFSRPELDLFI